MYTALWRVLPGNKWVKSILLAAIIAAAIAALMLFIFPWFDNIGSDPTIGE